MKDLFEELCKGCDAKALYDEEYCDTCNLKDDIAEHDKQIRADAIKEYKQSEEYIKECVQRYLKGRADIQSELMTEVAMLNETKMTEGDLKCFAYRIKAIAEKKMCSNGQPCTHPNCKRCGTTHFMSECDYGKEQKQ